MRLTRFLSLCLVLAAIVCIGSTASATGKTVAVANFRINSPNGRLDYLAEGLASTMAVKLANAPGVVVVERSRLNEALAELRLGISGVLDATTASQLGRQVGAQQVVLGELVDYNGLLQLSVRVVDVETGSLHTGFTDECNNERDLPRALDRLAVRLAAYITGDTDTQNAIDVNPHSPVDQLADLAAVIGGQYQEQKQRFALGLDLSTVTLFSRDKVIGYPVSSIGLNIGLGASYRRYIGQPSEEKVVNTLSSVMKANPEMSITDARNATKDKLGVKLLPYGGIHTILLYVPTLIEAGITYDRTDADGVGMNINAGLVCVVLTGNIVPVIGVQYTF